MLHVLSLVFVNGSSDIVCLCSPSGCTFWGKKPWSRKKKILWQLGTLVGAPLGIGLVAGLAVPAMIIGEIENLLYKYYALAKDPNLKVYWSFLTRLYFHFGISLQFKKLNEQSNN